MSKTIFVSNRLPVTVSKKQKVLSYEHSIGGLATGLKGYHQNTDALWAGWPGISSDKLLKQEETEIKKHLIDMYKSVPVFLSEKDISMYYEGFSNRTIWPLFHYFQDKTEHDVKTWERYKKVNQLFYESIKPYIDEDSVIWVHDYQLMLLPELIRTHHPHVKIGFFLHIPFPSYEIFRLLIWKSDILKGLLGSDLIGFHTYDYVRHFLSSVRRTLNITQSFYKLSYNNRYVRVDAFPMGIDYDFFHHHPIKAEPKEKQMKILLSVDRLDYTKGIIERLHAYQTFLEKYPKYHKKVKLHLIVAPSRAKLEAYDVLHKQIENLVSQINGIYGSFEWMPIWYLYQSFSQEELIKYYKTSDILLVTPLRDGMNLVAKEYIASRNDHQGMLIISETAGAASELSEAIIINPNDQDQIALGIKQALEMSKEERKNRNLIMHERLKRYNVEFWATEFLNRLNALDPKEHVDQTTTDLDIKSLHQSYHQAQKRLIMLDYDGTLMAFKSSPSHAYPTRKLKQLIQSLSNDPKNDVVIISGRDHQTLEKWFKSLNVSLVGDHGLWHKQKGMDWTKTVSIDVSWKQDVKHLLKTYVDRMPGAFIEEKSYSIALHYRASEPEMVSLKLNEIKDALFTLKGGSTLEMQEGHKVIEIKDHRVNKGIASRFYSDQKDYDFILTAGDDTTDEDLFKVQKSSFSIKIGYGVTHAKHRVDSVEAFKRVLLGLIQLKGEKK